MPGLGVLALSPAMLLLSVFLVWCLWSDMSRTCFFPPSTRHSLVCEGGFPGKDLYLLSDAQKMLCITGLDCELL